MAKAFIRCIWGLGGLGLRVCIISVFVGFCWMVKNRVKAVSGFRVGEISEFMFLLLAHPVYIYP